MKAYQTFLIFSVSKCRCGRESFSTFIIKENRKIDGKYIIMQLNNGLIMQRGAT